MVQIDDQLFINIDESLRGRRVVIRIDINSTLDEQGNPRDTSRVSAALETLLALSRVGAKTVALAHLGEKGESLSSLATLMQASLPTLRFFISHDREVISQEALKLTEGEVLLLENVRTFDGEKDCDKGLSAFFASLGQLFINDAFPVAHRKQSSTYGIAKESLSYFGPVMKKELSFLSKSLNPEQPSLLILGGAKLSTKLPLIEKYLSKGTLVYVGGAMVHNIMRAKGYSIGQSLYDSEFNVDHAVRDNPNLLLPSDVVCDDGKVYAIASVPEDRKIYDAGPKTVSALRDTILQMKTVIMNGPVGYYEGGFDGGTKSILSAMGEAQNATTILGGGDTLTVLHSMEKEPNLTFVSLGGGAMLDYLTEGTLPAIDAVIDSRKTLQV